jgi:hypothetical protein
MDEQGRHIRRCHPGEATRFAEGAGAIRRQLLPGFDPETADRPVIDVLGQWAALK